MATDDSPFRILYQHWQNEYQAAMLELDRKKLPAGHSLRDRDFQSASGDIARP